MLESAPFDDDSGQQNHLQPIEIHPSLQGVMSTT